MSNFKRILKIVAGLTSVFLFVLAFQAVAQTDNTTKLQDLKERAREKAGELRQNIKREGADLKKDIRAKKEEVKKDVQAKREEIKKELDNKKEEAKKRLEEMRQKAKTEIDAKRTEFKKRAEQIRDEKKKNVALKLDAGLKHINEQWTTHFSKVLDRLSEILGKVELRAEKAKANDKNIMAVTTAVENAKQAIAAAKTAVEAQVQKSYVATFASEDKLRDTFKEQRNKLHQDLFGLRDGLIKEARKAVQDALQSLRGVPKVDEESAADSVPSGATDN